MKKNTPALPIRRVLTSAKQANPNKQDQLEKNERSLRFENLEDRRVLSATGLDPGTTDVDNNSGFFATNNESDFGFQQDEAISYLKILVNGEERELSGSNNVLNLVAGDTVEVSEIGVRSDATDGVFAAEGYVNKIGDLTSASLIDYNDGRFSDRAGNFAANGGDGIITGLNNTWQAESGWDRLTVNLLHYTEEATEVAGRFFVNMQVGLPDFELDTAVIDQIVEQEITIGDAVTIPGAWLNNNSGLFHNYAEVDVYHESDTELIIWAGALVGNAGDSVEGEFVNSRDNDGFTERWIPTQTGEYVLKYYVDPENINIESNEDNNEYEIRLTVSEEVFEGPIAVDDVVDASDSIDVLENDVPTHEAETIYAEDFESNTSLAWTTNPNGTDTATTGQWEATDPVGTSWNGVELQLEDAAQGQQALVTGGQDDGSVGLNDVDGGVTSAISEAISVPESRDAELTFKYTFAHLSNASSEDFLRVSVVGESSTEVVLEERGDTSNRAGEWVDFSINLSEYAGQDIQILVEAGDLGSKSLVEAGIDDVAVTVAESQTKIHDFTQGENGTVALNSDGTFTYTANEGFSGEDTFQYNLTDGENVSNFATVTVTVGESKEDYSDLGIMTGTSGDFPLGHDFFGLEEGDTSHTITLSGLPDFVKLSSGEFDGETWTVDSADLEGLQIKAAVTSDTQGWTDYQDAYLHKTWDIKYSVTADGAEAATQAQQSDTFQFTTWQKKAEAPVGDRSGFELVNLNDFYNADFGGGFIATYQYTVSDASIVGEDLQAWVIDGGYTGNGEKVNVFVNDYNGPTNRSSDGSYDIGNTEVDFQRELNVGDTFTVSFHIVGAGFSESDFDPIFIDSDNAAV